MESLVFSFNQIFPLVLIMGIGFLLKRYQVVCSKTLDDLNSMIFHVFLPAMLFADIYTSKANWGSAIGLMAYTIVLLVLIFVISWLIVSRGKLPNKQKSVVIQALYRSNFAMLGIPLCDRLLGSNSTGLAATMTAAVIPVMNILAVVVLEAYSDEKPKLRDVLLKIAKNPLIIACTVSILLRVFSVPLPVFVPDTAKLIGRGTTAIALIMLGASMNFGAIKGFAKILSITVFCRLFVIPAIGIGLAALMGFSHEALVVTLIIFGGPAAVSSYTMARQLNADYELAGQILFYSSALCMFSYFVFISIFRAFGVV